jgi:hypothetical protein
MITIRRSRLELRHWTLVVIGVLLVSGAESCASEKGGEGALAPEAYARPQRYQGVRWRMVYEDCTGIQEFGVHELYGVVQGFVPYTLEVGNRSDLAEGKDNIVLVGTVDGNSEIKAMVAAGLISAPTRDQGYTITCFTSKTQGGRREIVVAGFDDRGVAYGACELCKRLLSIPREANDGTLQDRLSQLGDLRISEAPSIETRGIWCWGYTIYDYQGFLDNMARLKYNKIVIWNDVPPRNADEFIEYAHNRGIKVVFGYSWGWGLKDLDPNNGAQKEEVKKRVLETYRTQLRPLQLDGIYFQTFTETFKTHAGSRTIAALYCEWVNEIAGALLEQYPGLKIEAGLHASSVRNDLDDLKRLDPRLQIVWEDAGGMPWSYDPLREPPQGPAADKWDTPEKTLAYAKQLATLRDSGEFQMVAKGWTILSWATKFEHHGDFLIGVRNKDFIRARYAERRSRWDYVNTLWLENYPWVQHFYKEIRQVSHQPMTVLALVEDGVLEEKIEPSVALGAELLWNPDRQADEILNGALSPYFGASGR